MEPEAPDRQRKENGQLSYSPDDARQGTIILRHWWSRAIFILGLAGSAVLAIILAAMR